MKITVVSAYQPELSSGSMVRLFYLLKMLSQKHTVTFLYGFDTPENQAPNTALQRLVTEHGVQAFSFKIPDLPFAQRVPLYLQNKIPYVEQLRRSDFKSVMKHIPPDTDIFQITELFSYFVVESYLDSLPGKKVLDAHNVDYLRLKAEFDSSPFLRKIAGIPIVKKLKRYELQAIKKMKYLLVCSEQDKKIYQAEGVDTKIIILPNGTELVNTNKNMINITPGTVLFMGLLSYFPNQKGLEWYLNGVHQVLKVQNSTYSLTILGKNAPDWLVRMAERDSSIKLKGFVENLKEELSIAEVCICPLLSGSGTRLKILEYMALGKPVVSTTVGAEGISVTHTKNVLLADTHAEFAHTITLLLKNKKTSSQIGNEAKKLIETRYTWADTAKDYLQTISV